MHEFRTGALLEKSHTMPPIAIRITVPAIRFFLEYILISIFWNTTTLKS